MVSSHHSPLVSVVIPTCRGGAWLDEAVRSVLDQTLGDLEVVVVDDGVLGGVGALSRLDGRIRVITNPARGAVTARNTGNVAARGHLVAQLDDDDRWMPDKLEVQLARLEAAPSAAMCHTQFEIIDEGGVVVGPGWSGELTVRSAVSGSGGVRHSSTLWRRDLLMALGGYDPGAWPTEDADLFLRTVELFEVVFCPQVLVQYRMHGGQDSGRQRYRQVCEAAYRTNRLHEPRLAAACPGVKPRLVQRSRQEFVKVALDSAIRAARRSQLREAAGHLAWMLEVDPVYSVPLLGRRSIDYVGRRVMSRRGSFSTTV